MAASRIEQLIEDIYEFIESCKMQPLSSTKVIVPKDELYDLIDELRLRTPDEIKKYQKIIANRDAILKDAEDKAAALLNDAREQTSALISEHEIMQQAYYQANQIVSQAEEEAARILNAANKDANDIRYGAIGYTNDMLADVENILNNAYESTRTKYDGFFQSLKGNLDIVINNRKELNSDHYSEATTSQNEEVAYSNEEAHQNADGEYEFDENTFLDNIN
ncbi:ATPase [Anaeromicropila herbilytica]|uniref:ATPase n=1 Tax=Anaeromicropila herbilytica TaxID=2785025 RepID=A0A7R7EKD2_9FIRM|nr:ATPase [Anaeromicropila herbilytica]BCN30476.1 hypothetical protein bsdtb5_17710 [Anaeromicropila herbilytica]